MGYCSSCGIEIPDSQSTCSMCYGDPYHGSDGYYLDYLRSQEEEEVYEEYTQEQLEKEKEE